MLSITRRIGTSFSLVWPCGATRECTVVDPGSIGISSGDVEHYRCTPCTIHVPGSDDFATIYMNRKGAGNVVQVAIAAPLSIRVERDDVKSRPAVTA